MIFKIEYKKKLNNRIDNHYFYGIMIEHKVQKISKIHGNT